MSLTSSRNAQRAGDSLELVRLDERRVREIAGVELAVLQEAGDVLGAEAVSDAAQALDAELALKLLDDGVDEGVELLRGVVLEPARQVEALGDVDGDGVAVEEVGDDDEVAVGGVLVGDAAVDCQDRGGDGAICAERERAGLTAGS